MRFLATNSALESAVAGLLKSCKRARWAVAWASSNAPCFKLLTQQQSKIAQLTVGTHFYQTDSEFIASFIKHSNAQFVLNPSGVFHPKLYYFEHSDGRWDCVVGSPPSKNVELDDCWSKVSERIVDSNWWNAPKPIGGLERRIWRCRAAFLDVRFYFPD